MLILRRSDGRRLVVSVFLAERVGVVRVFEPLENAIDERKRGVGVGLNVKRRRVGGPVLKQPVLKQPRVKRVCYPGLNNSDAYAIMKKQARGFGAMISFELDSKERAIAALTGVKTILFAESLGGAETLLTYPIAQTHASVPKEALDAIQLNDRILRLSVGIENVQDLVSDLDQAING